LHQSLNGTFNALISRDLIVANSAGNPTLQQILKGEKTLAELAPQYDVHSEPDHRLEGAVG
jgi:hypothetical protein